MSNNDMDRVFVELKALFQKKGYLFFDDLEKGIDGQLLFEVQGIKSYWKNDCT